MLILIAYQRSIFPKWRLIYIGFVYRPTNDRIMLVIGGMDVNRTVIVPNKLIDRLERAAALGSVRRRTAVATADEFAPSVTPLVT